MILYKENQLLKKAKNQLNWTPKIDLNNGIEHTIRLF